MHHAARLFASIDSGAERQLQKSVEDNSKIMPCRVVACARSRWEGGSCVFGLSMPRVQALANKRKKRIAILNNSGQHISRMADAGACSRNYTPESRAETVG